MNVQMSEDEFTGSGATTETARKPPIFDDFPALKNFNWYYDGEKIVIPSMPVGMQNAINNHPKWGTRIRGN